MCLYRSKEKGNVRSSKKIEIIEGAVCLDHVHLCVSIPPKQSVSEFVGYLKGKSNNGIVKGATKSLGFLGTGLSYYSNYHDAKADGLSGAGAHSQAVTDTAVDVTVSTAVQTGFTVAGTAFIPIPGVGTAIGVGIGIMANIGLNYKFGKSDKSLMDRVKSEVNKIKGWFS